MTIMNAVTTRLCVESLDKQYQQGVPRPRRHHLRRPRRRIRLDRRAVRCRQVDTVAVPDRTHASVRRSGGPRRRGPPGGPSQNISIVFQEYTRSLMPWLTVEKNVGLPLKARGVPRSEIERRVADVLVSVGLTGTGSKHPWQLSGGMQQRVAIARAW